jgi:hypothetical protein
MQRVSTPRIYVSYGDWWKAMGKDVRKWNLLNPKLDTKITITSGGSPWAFIDVNAGEVGSGHNWTTPLNYKGIEDCNWFASLNHNVDERFKFILKQQINYVDGTSTSDSIGDSGYSVAVNYPIEYSGFSLIVKDNMWNDYSQEPNIDLFKIHYGIQVWDATNVAGSPSGTYFEEDSMTFNVGCGVFGKTYDFPNAADLNLTQTIEMDGITHQTTKGGVRLSDVKYKGSPKWGDLGAWELQSYSATGNPESWSWNSQLNARSGRRVFDLSFSYISDTDMFPISSLGNGTITDSDNYDSTDISTDGTFTDDNLLGGDDLVSSVWNRTLGGRLPFIFQPDKDNANPDQFAICKFDQDSLDIDRVAPNVYNIKLKIREVW